MWKPVNTEYYFPQVPASVVNLYSKSGADHLRFTLEAHNCAVLLHRPNSVADFLKIISQGESAPRYMIIETHGLQEGICFWQFYEIEKDKEFDKSLLHNDCLPPNVIRQHTNLPGCTVINTGCYGGLRPMAEAFLAGGVSAYIGCRIAYGTDFLTHFLDGALGDAGETDQLSDRDAWRRAVDIIRNEAGRQFSYFHSDGREERA